MQALPLWDASYFEGAWMIRRDGGSETCRMILTKNAVKNNADFGYGVTAEPRCLDRIGLKGLGRWMTNPGGISLFSSEGKFMGSYSRLNEDVIKGWAPPNIKYTLTRARS
jgi:hypothetical protein